MRVLLVRHASAGDRCRVQTLEPAAALLGLAIERRALGGRGGRGRGAPGGLPAAAAYLNRRQPVEQLERQPFTQAAAADLERNAE
jgi:hypothetical protein